MAITEPHVEAPAVPWVPEDTYGDRLARIRRQMHWNVSQAAEACGVSHQSWRNWEAGGQPSKLMQTTRQIADASGCDPNWLLLGAENCWLLGHPDLELVPAVEGQLSFDDVEPARPDLKLVLGGVGVEWGGR